MENKKRLNIDDLTDIVTVQEVSLLLGISRKTVEKLIYSDQLKSFKFGKSRLILKQDLLELIGYSIEKDKMIKEQYKQLISQKEETTDDRLKIASAPIPTPKLRHGLSQISLEA